MKEKSLRQEFPKLYAVWAEMRYRCNSPTAKAYKNYGGRGIKVSSEWDEFNCFCKWSFENGYEEGLTIDRIDNDGNYSPENCRWITIEDQQMNRQEKLFATINGITKRVHEWCKEYDINYQTANTRHSIYGWDWEKAITYPVQKRKKPSHYKVKHKRLKENN